MAFGVRYDPGELSLAVEALWKAFVGMICFQYSIDLGHVVCCGLYVKTCEILERKLAIGHSRRQCTSPLRGVD